MEVFLSWSYLQAFQQQMKIFQMLFESDNKDCDTGKKKRKFKKRTALFLPLDITTVWLRSDHLDDHKPELSSRQATDLIYS